MSKKENTTLKEATEKKFEIESSMQKGNITQEARQSKISLSTGLCNLQ